jgi:hypothetical protein
VNIAVEGVLKWILHALNDDITRGIWSLFAQLFLSPMAVFQDNDVMQVQVFMTTVALGMLPVLVIIQALRLSAARALGINTMPPEQLAHRTILAGIACTSISTIVWVIITFGDNITQAFAAVGLDLSVLKLLLSPPEQAGLGLLFMCIILLIGAVLLTIQKAVISAELAAMLAFGPVTGLSLLSNLEGGFFQTWLRETASLILTPVVQLILTWLFLRKVASFGDVSMSWGARLLTFGYFYVIWKCPSWLRQFCYSAGHADLLVQGGASVGRFVVMRKMMATAAKTVVTGGAAS